MTAVSEQIVSPFGIAFDGDRMIVDDDAVKRLRRPRLSPSTAKAMHGCPSRWAGEKLLPGMEDPFAPAPLGTAAHAVLEALYKLPALERTHQAALEAVDDLGDEMAAAAIDKGWPGIPDTQMADWKRSVVKHYGGIWMIEDPTTVNVRATEISLKTVEVGGVPFTGIIDRLDYDGDGKTLVRDHKSGNVPSNYSIRNYGDSQGDQLRLYAEALRALDGRLPTGAALYYTQFGQIRKVSLSKAKRSETVVAFQQSWTDLNGYFDSQELPTQTGPLCGWCPMVAICPAAKAEGLGPRIEGLPTAEQLGMPVRRAAAAALVPGDGAAASTNTEGDSPMTKLHEDKPWEPVAQGSLNPNSYSATAAFGLVSMAVDKLTTNGEAVKPSAIAALAGTFAYIVETVQDQVSDSRSMQDGLHTRLRGALHTVIDMSPPPFGGTEDQWSAWVSSAVRRVRLIADAAVVLWSSGPGEAPWAGLAVAEGAEAA
ncbi:MAG: PD-(D/E)XK nuclease family protein [Actinomycetota bacterium]|nr:PD-(D/E)XK nuclease family protein [Actinomycetota bacterium]